MKTLTAKYGGELIYIHYVSKFLEYVLVSRDPEPVKQFKVTTTELTDVTEKELLDKLIEQELIEQQQRKR